MDYRPPGSSVHGIFQERTLEWKEHWNDKNTCHSLLQGIFWIEPTFLVSPALAGRFLTTCATWAPSLLHVKYTRGFLQGHDAPFQDGNHCPEFMWLMSLDFHKANVLSAHGYSQTLSHGARAG